MQWLQSLKRTRSGRHYSETSFTSKQFSRPTKRRKVGKIVPKNASVKNPQLHRAHIESLPAELLEYILIGSGNANLLKASPKIAVKLSGSQTLQRAVFIMAFYGHQAEELFKLFNFHDLIPFLDDEISSWQIRSLTKASLNSRWCTWQWVQDMMHFMLLKAIDDFEARTPAKVVKEASRENMEHIRAGGTKGLSLVTRAFYENLNNETDSVLVLQPYIFDIKISEMPPTWLEGDDPEDEEYHDLDDQMDLWRVSRWHMKFLGVIEPARGVIEDFDFDYEPESPFAEILTDLYGLDDLSFNDFHSALAIFAKEAEHYRQVLQAIRYALALDFYNYPEDIPYRVSPSLYRAMAVDDIIDKKNVSFLSDHFTRVQTVFQIAPSSFPRDDPVMQYWACWARERLDGFGDAIENTEWDMDDSSARFDSMDLSDALRGALKAREAHLAAHLCMNLFERFHVDHSILRYIKLGYLPEQNKLDPVFAGPIKYDDIFYDSNWSTPTTRVELLRELAESADLNYLEENDFQLPDDIIFAPLGQEYRQRIIHLDWLLGTRIYQRQMSRRDYDSDESDDFDDSDDDDYYDPDPNFKLTLNYTLKKHEPSWGIFRSDGLMACPPPQETDIDDNDFKAPVWRLPPWFEQADANALIPLS